MWIPLLHRRISINLSIFLYLSLIHSPISHSLHPTPHIHCSITTTGWSTSFPYTVTLHVITIKFSAVNFILILYTCSISKKSRSEYLCRVPSLTRYPKFLNHKCFICSIQGEREETQQNILSIIIVYTST